MKKRIIYIIYFLILSDLFSQVTELTFPLFDGSYEYMTMKQFNENYLSLNQLFVEKYLSSFPATGTNNKLCDVLKILPVMGLNMFVFAPITHEEGHRSVLTANGIGSISQPIFKPTSFLTGIAYVKGVSDTSLNNLRNTSFSDFIRMHTAGIESEYCLMQKDYKYIVLGINKIDTNINFPILFMDYYTRLIDIFTYSFTCIIDSNNGNAFISLEEEANEYERDIVGHDIYGMVHHIYHPYDNYKRYFNYCDLSIEEQKYVKSIAYKTLINFPLLMMLPIFLPSDETGFLIRVGNNWNIGLNMGYSLAPFGDYIDENIYIKINNVFDNPLRLGLYIREQKNKNTWFPAFGIELIQLQLSRFISANILGNIWWQPEDLSFTTDKAVFGGSVELGCNIYPFKTVENAKYEFGINLNCLYKTKGFQPEIMSMDEDFVFTAGISLRY